MDNSSTNTSTPAHLTPLAQPDYVQVPLAEAARILGYCKKTVERLCHRGELASIGTGRLRRVAISDIKAYQARHRNGEM